jgi:hypothetical protein
MDERDLTPVQGHDRYIPRFLLPFLPANPTVRDAIILSVGILLSTTLGIAAIYLVHKWVGVAVAAVGTAHFTVRYLFRILDRYNPKSKSSKK